MHISIYHLIRGKISLISKICSAAHFFGLRRIVDKEAHCLTQGFGGVRRNDQSRLLMTVDVARAGPDLTRNHWLAKHCALEKGYTKCLGAQMGREYDSVTQIEKCYFINIRQRSQEPYFGKPDLRGVFMQLGLDRP